MLSALISFLGGSVFRMLWGEFSAWLTARQEHKHELERLRLQEEIDAAQHARNQEAIKTQAEMGVKVVEVQTQGALSQIEATAWLEAVKATSAQTGIKWVDAWNAVIRPAVATWAIAMITGNYLTLWALDDNGWALSGAALGIYLADRALFKRGK